jgi:hypothetical protein
LALTFQSFLISAPLYLLCVRKLISIDFLEYAKQFWAPLISSLFMAIVLVLLQQTTIASLNQILFLSLLTTIGTVVYVICIRLLDPDIFRYLISLAPTKRA